MGRSIDGGAIWSPLKILHEVEGRCRSEPTSVVDNVTGHIFLMFNDGCQAQSTTRPMFTVSTDDGLTWSNASSIPVAKPGTGVMGKNVAIGLGRGLAVSNASLPSGL